MKERRLRVFESCGNEFFFFEKREREEMSYGFKSSNS